MTINYHFDPTKPLDGYKFLGHEITFHNNSITYSILNRHYITYKQLIETMLEMTIEYNDGEIVTIKDIVPEEQSAMIKFCIDDMKIDTPYPIADIRQRNKIIIMWDILHLQDEYEFVFSDDYSQFKKRKLWKRNGETSNITRESTKYLTLGE